MASFPAPPEVPQYEFSEVDLPLLEGEEPAGAAAPAKASWPRWLLVILLLVILILALSMAIPSLRTRLLAPAVDRVVERLPVFRSGEPPGLPPPRDGDEGWRVVRMANEPAATSTPTLTPHPAVALNFAVDEAPGSMRWQIAYAGGDRGPEKGCAYLSFRLSGVDAQNFAALRELDAELTIYDRGFIFERYGPTPLEELRNLGDALYYELPAGASDCYRHRFGELAQYAGMEFRLELQAGGALIRRYRGVLTAPDLAFATVTPTPTPAPPTPTPYPQVRIHQQVNVRSGPGTSYEILGTAQTGAVYPLLAISPQRDWLQIEFPGQRAWIYSALVEAIGVADVAVNATIPPTPMPTATFTPVPPTPAPTVAPTPYLPFLLTSNGVCDPNLAMTYFDGKVADRDGEPVNGVCIHVAYEGPRNTKCTGCDGAAPGKWGFAPFGNLPGNPGTTVRIYIVPCPEDGVPIGGQNPNTEFGPLDPVSPVWTYTIGESVQCTGITFTDNRYFDDQGKQIPPPMPAAPPSENELMRFSGQGQGSSPVLDLEAGPLVFIFSHAGQGVFTAQLLTSTGRFIDQLSIGSGQSDGRKRVEIPSKGPHIVAVTSADGAWTIVVERP